MWEDVFKLSVLDKQTELCVLSSTMECDSSPGKVISMDRERDVGSSTVDTSVKLNPAGRYAEGGVAILSGGSRPEGREDTVDSSGKIKVDESVLKYIDGSP